MLKKLEQYGSFLLPVLAALFSPLTLFAGNFPGITIEDVFRSLFISAAVAMLLEGLAWIILRDRIQAILTSTTAIVLFFSYGHFYQAIKPLNVMGISIGRHRYLLPLFILLFLGWLVWIRRNQNAQRNWYAFFQVAQIILILFPVYRLVSLGAWHFENADSAGENQEMLFLENSENYPDIYYIILDGYARADVLEHRYAFDNSDFLEQMEERGFYIAEEAMTNYPTTILSLTSSLNMDYLNDMFYEPDMDHNELLQRLHELFQHSEVRTVLEREGYFTVAYDTGYFLTQMEDADVYLLASQSSHGPNQFESMLMDTTMIRSMMDMLVNETESTEQLFYPRYEAHRNRIQTTLNSLGEIASRPERSFVFVHLVSPHPPFIFDANGERVITGEAFTFNDASDFNGSTEDYINGYSGQLTYLNTLVLDAVDAILARSEYPPYILIQADHGPGSELVWGEPSEAALHERFGILNAYYFPDGDYQSLYPIITPVNSFRVVLNHLLDRDDLILEDAYYYSYPANLLLMEEVQFPDTAPQ